MTIIAIIALVGLALFIVGAVLYLIVPPANRRTATLVGLIGLLIWAIATLVSGVVALG